MASLFLGLTSARALALSRVTWEPVASAQYYFLVISFADKTVSARTQATAIFLEEEARVNLWAIGGKDEVLAKLTVQSSAGGAQTLNPALAGQLEPKEAMPVSTLSLKERQKQAREKKKIARLQREREQAFSRQPAGLLSVQLGLGTETLQARGGDSEFSGSSLISSSRIDVELELARQHHTWQRQFWGSLQTHAFATEDVETTATEEIITRQLSVYPRFHLRSGLLQRLNTHPQHLWAAQVGFGASQLPVLQTTSAATGAADLSSQPYYGLGVGLRYAYQPHANLSYHSSFFYLPLTLGQWRKSEVWDAEAELRYFWLTRLFLITKLCAHTESLHYELTCPVAETSSCQPASRVTSTWQQISIGLGLKF